MMISNVNLNRRFFFTASYIVVFIAFFATFSPLEFKPIMSGLDPSWKAALNYASQRGFLFGQDVIFTGGPLSNVYTRQFDYGSAYWIALFSLLIIALLSTIWIRTTNGQSEFFQSIFLFLFLIFSIITLDSIFLFIPFIAGIHGLKNHNRLIDTTMVYACIFLAGALVLAKFSIFPLAILTTIILDTFGIFSRRWPLHSASFCLGLCCGYVVSGQSLLTLGAFITSSLIVSSGYSSAMSIAGSTAELFAWLTAAGGLLAWLLWLTWINRQDSEGWRAFARFVLVAGYLFVSFKAGMVRHDLHSLISWNSLLLIVLLFGSQADEYSPHTAKRFRIFAAVLIIPIHLVNYMESREFPISSPSDIAAQTAHEIEAIFDFAFQPTVWLEKLQQKNAVSAAAIRANASPPALPGRIDIIQSQQSALIASGLNYWPRPTIQEYTTYTPQLIQRNRSFFLGPSAPDYLLFEPGSIDGRHPASPEGALWPLFFSHYEPVNQSSFGLILKKRSIPLEDIMGYQAKATVGFDQFIDFPDTTTPWMVSIDIKPTLIGRLAEFLYRPPMVTLIVDYTDGTTGSYRLIPGMARDGMLLSPYVASISDYLFVSTGNIDFPGLKRAKALRIEAEVDPAYFFQPQIELAFEPINPTKLQAATSNAFLRDFFRRSSMIAPLLKANQMQEPAIAYAQDGIFAHAPAKLKLPTIPGHTILLRFGIREGAWSNGGDTDGVCFIVSSASEKLAERCLDPKSNLRDRGTQTIQLQIPRDATEIVLETACSKTCAWDWSYWEGVETTPP
jgi:hypothetical protein